MNWRWYIGLLVFCNILVWGWALAAAVPEDFSVYFLDVGQGDSELTRFDGVDILVDGGPDGSVMERLSEVLPFHDRYIDVVILSHPHQDHFGGLVDVLKYYDVGIFIDSGYEHTTAQYQRFKELLTERGVRRVAVARGDRLRYQDMTIDVLAPEGEGKEVHDNTIVFRLQKEVFRALFTGDINKKVERKLLRASELLVADVLKVSHHGSANSSERDFLRAVQPKVAVIGVGRGNRYGHPKLALLERLDRVGAQIFRTDIQGTMKVFIQEGRLHVMSEK